MTMNAQEIAKHIICLEESDELVTKQIDHFIKFLHNRTGGNDIQGLLTFRSAYWIPTTDAHDAYHALVIYLYDKFDEHPEQEVSKYLAEVIPLSFRQLYEMTQDETDLSFSLIQRAYGVKPDTSINKQLFQVRKSSRPSSRFATLICFEGRNAKAMAEAYGNLVEDAIRRNKPKIDSPAGLLGYDDTQVCCVEIHDCQKHPLKG